MTRVVNLEKERRKRVTAVNVRKKKNQERNKRRRKNVSAIEFNLRSKYLMTETVIHMAVPEVPIEGEDPRAFYESGKKYKVLWLLHGGSDNSSSWLRKSLIERYAAERDLMVVMPCAYNSYYTNWPDYLLNWETYFLEELMPMMYSWMPISTAREDNFIAGLSMGALGTAKFAALRPELFAGAAMLSAVPVNLRAKPIGRRDANIIKQAVMANGGLEQALESSDNTWNLLLKNKDRLPKMYASCGTADEHYEQLYVPFKEYAQKEGLPFTFCEIPGYDHEWRLWNQEIEKALDLFGIKALRRT